MTNQFSHFKIGNKNQVFVIAEAGVNHNNKLSLAKKMIDIASKAGADAIKFQTFSVDEIMLKKSIKPFYQSQISKKSYYEIIKNLEPSFSQQKKLFDYCKKKKILFLSTPYDKISVDFLNKLGVKAFKISSSDLTNHILLKYVLEKNKPILLSTGLSTEDHVDKAISIIKKHKMLHKLTLLQTTSDYPSKNSEVNLRVIPYYAKKYGVNVGFSDHTEDYTASLGAVALGAKVLEKHFTLSRKLSGPDQTSSLEPKELAEWITKVRILESSLGTHKKLVTKSESRNISMRKVLVIKPAIKNTVITIDHLRPMRSTKNGILPLEENLKKILGKKLNKNISKQSQFSWKMIKN